MARCTMYLSASAVEGCAGLKRLFSYMELLRNHWPTGLKISIRRRKEPL
jgi:hypothetical protein